MISLAHKYSRHALPKTDSVLIKVSGYIAA